ncbi:threonine synthase, partial [Francisella tularensis subsp. holarctica]|nr:threonine synthase [Francisella tularensis subsp. holarctica]
PAKFESGIEPILDIQVPPTPALQKLQDKEQNKGGINKTMDELCEVSTKAFEA